MVSTCKYAFAICIPHLHPKIETARLTLRINAHSPGRFYATAVMKTLLALFITKYDMQLEEKAATRYFAWRTFIYPYASTKVIFRPRASL
jgi:hypothetical protein